MLPADVTADAVLKDDATEPVLMLEMGAMLLEMDEVLLPMDPGIVVTLVNVELACVTTPEDDVDVVVWPLLTVVDDVVPAAAVTDELVV